MALSLLCRPCVVLPPQPHGFFNSSEPHAIGPIAVQLAHGFQQVVSVGHQDRIFSGHTFPPTYAPVRMKQALQGGFITACQQAH
jgi:hypothetical protein